MYFYIFEYFVQGTAQYICWGCILYVYMYTLCIQYTICIYVYRCGPWDFPGKNTGMGCHFLLQGIFPTQGSNPGLLHCRQTLYRLSHLGSPVYTIGILYVYSIYHLSFNCLMVIHQIDGIVYVTNISNYIQLFEITKNALVSFITKLLPIDCIHYHVFSISSLKVALLGQRYDQSSCPPEKSH